MLYYVLLQVFPGVLCFPLRTVLLNILTHFTLLLFRYGAVTVILVALLFWKEGAQAFRLEGKGMLLLFFGTMAFAVYNLLIFYGEDLLGESGVMAASIMESLMPMISIVIFWIMHRKRPYTFTLICVFLAFIGAFLVITKGEFRRISIRNR